MATLGRPPNAGAQMHAQRTWNGNVKMWKATEAPTCHQQADTPAGSQRPQCGAGKRQQGVLPAHLPRETTKL